MTATKRVVAATSRVARTLSTSASTFTPNQTEPISPLHILLQGVPRTTVPTDLRRLAVQRGIAGFVKQISLDYHRFSPTGKAFIVVDHEDNRNAVISALNSSTLMGHTIAASIGQPSHGPPARQRGKEGREEAAARGLSDDIGKGAQGGIVEVGRSVYISNIANITVEELRRLLHGYELVAGAGNIIKLPLQRNGGSGCFLVKLETPGEAHRLARNLHMTHYDVARFAGKFLTQAHVVY